MLEHPLVKQSRLLTPPRGLEGVWASFNRPALNIHVGFSFFVKQTLCGISQDVALSDPSVKRRANT